ncbi:UNVERIFIED_CONTAM: hypothetical protein Sradi_3055100 [Sesamum radiatum]|uniref:Uncharacterized protein n=1 Tax=Sesamum radiatum TaxID=300843 RepID=A0AAW2RBK7_SESRA
MAILPSPFHIAGSDWLCSNSNFLSFPSNPVRSSVHRPFVVTFSYSKDGVFDYISVTPPYMLVDYAVLMDQISNSSVVGENTFIVVEYPLRTDMLDSYASLIKIADRRFGRTHLAIYGPKWAQKKSKSER